MNYTPDNGYTKKSVPYLGFLYVSIGDGPGTLPGPPVCRIGAFLNWTKHGA